MLGCMGFVWDLSSLNDVGSGCKCHLRQLNYRKIPKISPSMYKPPELTTQKPLLNRPSKYKHPPPPGGGGLYLEISLKYKVKQNRNGKFPSNYKASPIDFETQFSSVDKPLKKGLSKI